MIALGERILAELGDSHTNNTLARWLAHHTARLIEAADQAREAGQPDADTRAADARAAILQLWQARSAWPSGWPPPRAAELVRTLDALPDLDTGGWYGGTVMARLHNLHHQILAALVDLATNDGTVDIEQGWLDVFGDQLTPDEALILRRAATGPRRLDALLHLQRLQDLINQETLEEDDTNAAPTTTAEHPLVQLADTYRNTILSLINPTPTKASGHKPENKHEQPTAPNTPDPSALEEP